MPKISLGMIVKNEEEILVKTLEAVKSIVDEFCIVDTGSTDGTKDIIKKYQSEVIEIPFEDFVTTKNKALEHCHGDYILWMDADEILYKGHQNLLDWVNKDVEAVNCKITEGDVNDYSITTCVYDRVRMWKNNGKWKFYGPGVHEVIVGENVTAVDDPNILVRHEHLKSDKAQTARDRFLFYTELLNNFIKDNPNDTRAWFYLGRTYMDVDERLTAISCFLKYLSIPNNTFRDEKFDVAYNIAKCYKAEGEYDKAISWCHKSLLYDYRRSEAYCVLGEIFFIKKDWSTAIKYYEKAIRTIPEDVMLFLDAFAYNKTPKDQLTLCYYYNKEFKKSEVITDSLRQDMLPTVDQRIINNLWWCRKFTHMKIFMCLGYTPEPLYGGMLKEQGVHGVETTYLELSDVLSRLGHDVYLFCRTEKEHVYDGVHFIPYEKIGEYLPIEPTVIIASRWYDSFYLESKAKKIVWLQDAYYADPQGRKIFDDCHLYVCSSPWHRDYTYQRFGHDITPNKFKTIPLGIRKNLFDVNVKRDPYKVIYSSNPDRGLYILMDMWDKIVEKIPNIHLSIYYGWDGLKTWNDSVEWQQSVENQKNKVMNWVNAHSNITLTGRLTKEELAKEFLSATLCLYPNNFFETFCLTALETQAASVPMITTDMGAMSTTLKRDFNVLIPGSPFTDLYKNKFIEETVNIMKNKTMLNAFAKGCKLYTDSIKCDWTDIGEEWQQLIWNLF